MSVPKKRRYGHWCKDGLRLRQDDRRSIATWMLVLEVLVWGEPSPGSVRAIRNITKLIRARRTPALFHNGRKP